MENKKTGLERLPPSGTIGTNIKRLFKAMCAAIEKEEIDKKLSAQNCLEPIGELTLEMKKEIASAKVKSFADPAQHIHFYLKNEGTYPAIKDLLHTPPPCPDTIIFLLYIVLYEQKWEADKKRTSAGQAF